MSEQHCAVVSFAPTSQSLDALRRENYSETLRAYKEARKSHEQSQKGNSKEVVWSWRTLGPLPRDLGPPPEFILPTPPQLRVLLDVDRENGLVMMTLCVAIEDLEVPGGLFTGLDNIPIPSPGTYRRGTAFYPPPESFLQVHREGEWKPDEDFEPPLDLPLPPWHYRRFCQLPERAPVASTTQSSEPWVHPYLRGNAAGQTGGRGRHGSLEWRRDEDRQRRPQYDRWNDGNRGKSQEGFVHARKERADRGRAQSPPRMPPSGTVSVSAKDEPSQQAAGGSDVWGQRSNDDPAVAAWNDQSCAEQTDSQEPLVRGDSGLEVSNGERHSEDRRSPDRRGRGRHFSPGGRRPQRGRGRFQGTERGRHSPNHAHRDDRRPYRGQEPFNDGYRHGRDHGFRGSSNRHPSPRRPYDPARGRRGGRDGPPPDRREWRGDWAQHGNNRRQNYDQHRDDYRDAPPDRRHQQHEWRDEGPRRDWHPHPDQGRWRGERRREDPYHKPSQGSRSYSNSVPIGSERPETAPQDEAFQ